ncbi:kinase-like protein [Patellaria atrata CBS 101060]|uniref:non-specific serine/threonine protein kinase n=1 Tax=Patellaria atrata CBS 101060 TaxID=1346257 RepID=A0A9P4S4B5_9PEZI|nr:kinase-like protein [Patellaria atrata CBS 101060]
MDAFPVGFKLLGQIGQGGEGTVSRYYHHPSRTLVAAKTFFRPRTDTRAPREARILMELRGCTKIAQLYEVIMNQPGYGYSTLLLEHCEYGDLRSFQDWHFYQRIALSEPFIWHVAREISEALAYLAAGGTSNSPTAHVPAFRTIVHRDVKLANVLLKVGPTTALTGFFEVKLADFGNAVAYDPSTSFIPCGRAGTYDIRPPEYPLATPAWDVWGLGCVVHLLALGMLPITRQPYEVPPEEMEAYARQEGAPEPLVRTICVPPGIGVGTNPPMHERQLAFYSRTLDVAMKCMLVLDPTKRMTAVHLRGIIRRL